MTLPSIVAQIREQKPGVVPEWLRAEPGCFADSKPEYMIEVQSRAWCGGVPESIAIAAIEAGLWRAYHNHLNPKGVMYAQKYFSHHAEGWSTHSLTYGKKVFGHEPLSLIRALCHAVGITLKEPHE